MVDAQGQVQDLGAEGKAAVTQRYIDRFAADGMRTIGLAYRDFVKSSPDWDALDAELTNANGSPALACVWAEGASSSHETLLTAGGQDLCVLQWSLERRSHNRMMFGAATGV